MAFVCQCAWRAIRYAHVFGLQQWVVLAHNTTESDYDFDVSAAIDTVLLAIGRPRTRCISANAEPWDVTFDSDVHMDVYSASPHGPTRAEAADEWQRLGTKDGYPMGTKFPVGGW